MSEGKDELGDLELRVKKLEDLGEVEKVLAMTLSDVFFSLDVCGDVRLAERVGGLDQNLDKAGRLISQILRMST